MSLVSSRTRRRFASMSSSASPSCPGPASSFRLVEAGVIAGGTSDAVVEDPFVFA